MPAPTVVRSGADSERAKLSPSDRDERLALHAAGMTNAQIAKLEGSTRRAVAQWLRSRGLAPHNRINPPLSEADIQRRTALYEEGLSDSEIGRREGVSFNTIRGWRKGRGLARKMQPRGPWTDEQRAARLFLYTLGYSDRRIAKEQKVRSAAVWAWRKKLGLPLVPGSRARSLDRRTSIADRIRRAIGFSLPKDIAEDAAADLYLDLLSGKLSIDKIEKEARRYGNRVLERFASRYGPRSLDEEIAEDGFSLLDTLVDGSSSGWLEEMGATVW